MNLKRKLEKLLLRKLLNSVSEDELFLNVSKEKATDLQLQATDYIQESSLFSQLLTEADTIAKIKMWRKSENLDDIRFARTMLYCTDVLRKKVKLLADNLPAQAQRVGR